MREKRAKHFLRRSGMSLVELLVSIAVVLVLVAIIFAVYPAIRDNSELSTCASNLRQIGMLAQLFSSDNGGEVLRAEMRPPEGKFDQANYWPQKLSGYIGPAFSHGRLNADGKPDYSVGVLRELACPTWFRMSPTVNWNPSYALFGSPAEPIYSDMIVNPSQKVFIADSPTKPSGATADDHWKGNAARPYSFDDHNVKDALGIVFRHNRRANFLFHDGHVASFTPDELPLPPKAAAGSDEFRRVFDWSY